MSIETKLKKISLTKNEESFCKITLFCLFNDFHEQINAKLYKMFHNIRWTFRKNTTFKNIHTLDNYLSCLYNVFTF